MTCLTTAALFLYTKKDAVNFNPVVWKPIAQIPCGSVVLWAEATSSRDLAYVIIVLGTAMAWPCTCGQIPGSVVTKILLFCFAVAQDGVSVEAMELCLDNSVKDLFTLSALQGF